MKPLFTEEEIKTIINDIPCLILTIIIGLIEEYFNGNLDIDQLIILLENL